MTAPAAQQQQGPTVITAEQFLGLTKKKSQVVQSLQSSSYSADGAYVQYQLPKTGLGYKVWTLITGKITIAGTVAGGTWAYNAPYSFIKNRQFGSNGSFQMRNFSGWGQYKWMRTRFGFDPSIVGKTDNYAANNQALLGTSNVTNPVVPGAALVAQQYNVVFALPMMLAYNDAGENGLVVLQSYDTVYTDQLQWGQIVGGISSTGGTNDIFNGLTGTGLSVTVNSLSIQYTLDYFDVPQLGPSQAFKNGISLARLTSRIMCVNETTQLLNAGPNQYQLPKNELYTMVITELTSSTPAPLVTTNAPSNIVWRHNGSVIDHQDNYVDTLQRGVFEGSRSVTPPDGCIIYDFGRGRTFNSRRDTLDSFNDQQVTALELDFSLPAGYSSGGVLTCTTESLKQITTPTIATA